MKITRRQLKRIISEVCQHSLHELYGPNLPNVDDPPASEKDKDLAIATAEVILGFTPAGLAIDFKDLAKAIKERDPVFAAMAGIGFIPFIGDLFKVPYKIGKAGTSQVKALDKLASIPKCTIAFIVRGTNGANFDSFSAMEINSGINFLGSTNRVTSPI